MARVSAGGSVEGAGSAARQEKGIEVDPLFFSLLYLLGGDGSWFGNVQFFFLPFVKKQIRVFPVRERGGSGAEACGTTYRNHHHHRL